MSSSNYVQRRAIHPGPVNVAIFAGGGLKMLESVAVLPTTGLYMSNFGPANLEFGKIVDQQPLPPGSWSNVTFELRNRGDRPARQVSVSTSTDGSFQARDAAYGLPAVIPGHATVKGRVWVKPDQEGKIKLVLLGSSTSNHPGASYVILSANAITGGASSEVRSLAKWAGVIAVGALILLLGLPHQQRRRAVL